MKIIYSLHAEQRLSKRKISKKLVESALKEPDEIIQDESDILVAHKFIVKNNAETLLRVFYKRQNGKGLEILTAYLTTKIYKYYVGRKT